MAINERLSVTDSISFTIRKTKDIRDGKVGVLYSPGFGAGWFTWHGIEELLFSPEVIAMVEEKEKIDPSDDEGRFKISEKILRYCQTNHDPEAYYGGCDDLTVTWLDLGTEFYVDEYDGSETIRIRDSMPWIKA